MGAADLDIRLGSPLAHDVATGALQPMAAGPHEHLETLADQLPPARSKSHGS